MEMNANMLQSFLSVFGSTNIWSQADIAAEAYISITHQLQRRMWSKNPWTLHVVRLPVAQIIPLSGGMNNGVNTQTVLETKSLTEMPRTKRCWGLDRLKEDRVICDMIMSDPIAEKKHVILWRTKSAISYFSFILKLCFSDGLSMTSCPLKRFGIYGSLDLMLPLQNQRLDKGRLTGLKCGH